MIIQPVVVSLAVGCAASTACWRVLLVVSTSSDVRFFSSVMTLVVISLFDLCVGVNVFFKVRAFKPHCPCTIVEVTSCTGFDITVEINFS